MMGLFGVHESPLESSFSMRFLDLVQCLLTYIAGANSKAFLDDSFTSDENHCFVIQSKLIMDNSSKS